MLGVYTRHFGDCSVFAQCLAEGLDVELKMLFFGWATGVVDRRP